MRCLQAVFAALACFEARSALLLSFRAQQALPRAGSLCTPAAHGLHQELGV